MNLNKYLKYSILTGLFVMPFILFYVPNNMFFPYITGKAFLFRLVVEIIFALWIILALRDHNYKPKFSWILGSFAIFIGLIFISDVLSPNQIKSFWSNFERMEGWILLAHLFAYLIVLVSVLKEEKIWIKIFNVYIGASVLMSIYGILQLAEKIPYHMGQGRVDATLGNPAYLAVYLLIHIFLAGYLLIKTLKNKNQNWSLISAVYGLIIVLELFVLFHTGTRGTLGGFVIGLIIGLGIYTFKAKKTPKLRKASLGILLVILLAVGTFYSIRKSDFVTKSNSLSRVASVFEIKNVFFSRSNIWGMAWQGFKEKPVFGWGQESFNYVFNKHYKPEMWSQEQWFDRAHNVFFDWMVAGGILGLLSYLSLFFFAFWYIWKRNNLNLEEKSLFTALLSAYFIHNFFVFDHLASYVLFVLILAFIHNERTTSVGELVKDHDHTDKKNKNKELNQNDSASIYTSPVVILILLVVMYFIVVRPYKANINLISALKTADPSEKLSLLKKSLSYNTGYAQEINEQMLFAATDVFSGQASVEIKSKWFEETKKEMLEQIKKTSQDARERVLFGQFLSQAGQNEEAENELLKASELSPKKQTILIPLGINYLIWKKESEAYQVFKKTYELDKRFDIARINFGISAARTNKFDEAISLLEPELLSDKIYSDVLNAFAVSNNIPKLILFYEKSKIKNPNNLSLRTTLINLYVNTNQKNKAILELNQIKKIWPDTAEKADEFLKQILSS